MVFIFQSTSVLSRYFASLLFSTKEIFIAVLRFRNIIGFAVVAASFHIIHVNLILDVTLVIKIENAHFILVASPFSAFGH